MVTQYGNTYYGNSGDDKPTGTALNGRAFVEMDTSKIYHYDADSQTWYEWCGRSDGGGGSDDLPK